MKTWYRRVLIPLVAVSMLAAACSSGSEETTTTTQTPTTTLASTTTTGVTTTTTTTTTPTIIEVGNTINGLPEADDTLVNRRAIAVKIDNHPRARPHSGIETADVVYELLVEAGLTRFIAVFHQSDTDRVGPVRSLRPTDPEITIPLGAPLQVSGSANWVRRYAANLGAMVLSDSGASTYRDFGGRAPHNLYADTGSIRGEADGRGWSDARPPSVLIFGAESTPLQGEASRIELPFSDSPDAASEWTWDGEQYVHSYGGEPHTWIDGEGAENPVTADILVVMSADRYTARPARPSDGNAVPATHTVGTGDALVFHSGGVIEATWTRDSIDELIRIIDNAEGADIIVPPGRVWVSIFPDDRTLSWE